MGQIAQSATTPRVHALLSPALAGWENPGTEHGVLKQSALARQRLSPKTQVYALVRPGDLDGSAVLKSESAARFCTARLKLIGAH